MKIMIAMAECHEEYSYLSYVLLSALVTVTKGIISDDYLRHKKSGLEPAIIPYRFSSSYLIFVLRHDNYIRYEVCQIVTLGDEIYSCSILLFHFYVALIFSSTSCNLFNIICCTAYSSDHSIFKLKNYLNIVTIALKSICFKNSSH